MKISRNGEINERNFSNPYPWALQHQCNTLVAFSGAFKGIAFD